MSPSRCISEPAVIDPGIARISIGFADTVPVHSATIDSTSIMLIVIDFKVLFLSILFIPHTLLLHI
nr:hypothetical protein GZ17F1_3 [uncultured archaeon GZfos17F1]